MRRNLISLLLAASTAACLAQSEQAVEARAGANVCRYELAALPAPMVLFDLNVEVGGSSCFTGTDTLLFLPAKGASCIAPEGIRTHSATYVSQTTADAELRSCFPLARTEPLKGTGSITYTRLVEDVDLLQFGLDTNALAVADGLPITRILVDDTRVCVETNRPSVVDQRVRMADIINFQYIRTSRSAEHCSAFSFNTEPRVR